MFYVMQSPIIEELRQRKSKMLDRHVVHGDSDCSQKFVAGRLNALITGDRTAIFGN